MPEPVTEARGEPLVSAAAVELPQSLRLRRAVMAATALRPAAEGAVGAAAQTIRTVARAVTAATLK